MDLFKGFIELNDKKSVEKIKGRIDFKTYDQCERLNSFGGVIRDDVILLDFDDELYSQKALCIINDYNLKCRVYKTTRGIHAYFLNQNGAWNTNSINQALACGLSCDIKCGSKTSYGVLKKDGVLREIIYDTTTYDELPKVFMPVKFTPSFIEMGAGDGRNQAVFNYILNLQSNDFSVDESRDVIRIINKYIMKEPLDDREIEIILRDDSFDKPVFFKKGQFLHDVFGNYLKSTSHIIRLDNELYCYRDGIYKGGQLEIEFEMMKSIPCLTRAKRSEVYSYLDVLLRDNQKRADSRYIAFNNGILDVIKDELLPYDSKYILTNKIPHNYNKDAYSKVVDDTLNKIACDDKNIRALLEECVGYCFFSKNELGKAFFFTGGGSNGKSTFNDMIRTALGDDNTSSLDLRELGDRFRTAELVGKLVNIGDDISDDFIKDSSLFKKVVTGDKITVERKGQQPFSFAPSCKQIFSANSIPRVGRGRDTMAILRRLVIVPFNATFKKTDSDFRPFIKYELREESAIEYLIRLAVEGLKRVLINNDFTSCNKTIEQLKEYEEMNNPLITFFKEHDINDFINEPTSKAYRVYQDYCFESSLNPLSKIEFSRQIKKELNLEIVDRSIDGKRYRIFVKH